MTLLIGNQYLRNIKPPNVSTIYLLCFDEEKQEIKSQEAVLKCNERWIAKKND
jgi:hypothetical protein